MEKAIGIVVCNYNKQDYVVNCIDSILKSDIQDFDIYVVDNASEDQSVVKIREAFADKVNLIVNADNLGGSGGFNTGLREALRHDYEYLMCVDNDVLFAPETVRELKEFLDAHPEAGMVGSRVYYMDEPDKIWSYGGTIDYERYVQVDNYRNLCDGSGIPDYWFCDYVPACSLMARTSVVRKIGIMPEENFIYLDDMEWGYRFNQAGYKVAVCAQSKAWHKGGGRNTPSTFNHYYIWRNRIRFFMKTLPQEKKEHFAQSILTEMFRMIYSVYLKGETNVIRTLMYAFDDAVHGVSGKAAEGRVLPRPPVRSRLCEALKDADEVLIKFNGDYEGLGNIIRGIRKEMPTYKICISAAACPDKIVQLKEQYAEYEITDGYEPDRYPKHLVMCSHIFKITANMPQDVYIDAWCNIIYTPQDYIYAGSFEQTKELFLLCKKGLLLDGQNG